MKRFEADRGWAKRKSGRRVGGSRGAVWIEAMLKRFVLTGSLIQQTAVVDVVISAYESKSIELERQNRTSCEQRTALTNDGRSGAGGGKGTPFEGRSYRHISTVRG